jgi:stearoyl-CoA desaturase (delta-9 desaturase)
MLAVLHDAIVEWLANGYFGASWWQIVIYTLVTTHITIVAVTIFLHRAQAHRALELGPVPSHLFRLWLWLYTGMVTKQWVSIHRKHHAKCETVEDPHSPVTRGIKTVLLTGSELYRAEAKNEKTLDTYGRNTPDDWLERNLYSRYYWQGVGLTLVLDLFLFGAAGAVVWAVQMAWIPVTAAGIINGLGHWWGYRNFEAPDASTNLSPIGFLIGGEELHNNHHTYPTSAKLSVKPWEFDIGWSYIRILEWLGWAKVRKTPPKLVFGQSRLIADSTLLEALVTHRYAVMALLNQRIRGLLNDKLTFLKEFKGEQTKFFGQVQLCRRWLGYPDHLVPESARTAMVRVAALMPEVKELLEIKQELAYFWTDKHSSEIQLIARLQFFLNQSRDSWSGNRRYVAELTRQIA